MANLKQKSNLEDIDKEARAIQASGLPYRPISVKRDEIDLVHSQTFNSRFENRINDENVMKLAVLLERGVQLPRITVFYDQTLKKFVVVSGVHRVTGHELADMQTPLEAFEIVVNPPGDPDTMRRIADLGAVLNTTGPLGLSRAETLAAAIRAVHERGEDMADVADRLGLRHEDIASAYDNWKLDRELIHNGLTPTNFKRKGDKQHVLTLPSTTWMREMEHLLEFVDKSGNPLLTGPAFANIAQQIRNEKSEVNRQNIIRKARDDLKSGRKVTRKQPNRQNPRSVPNFVWKQMVCAANDLSIAELVASRATSGDAARQLMDELSDVQRTLGEVQQAVKARWGS